MPEDVNHQLESVLKMPLPQDAYKVLEDPVQELIAETTKALADEIRSCTLELSQLEPTSKQYLTVAHVRQSSFEMYRRISGIEGAEEQASAVTKALVKVEAALEKDQRSHEGRMKRAREEALAGLISDVNPRELAEHIDQQDAVDAERGIKRPKESPLMKIAREHANKEK